MKPARSPSSWCDRPPVPITTTRLSLSHDWIARPTAWPSAWQRAADGSLTLELNHARPADTANWLPAPAGRFYLILRMYYPRDGVQSWRIPELRPLQD